MNKNLLLKNCVLYNSKKQDEYIDILIENGIIKKIGTLNNEHYDTINLNGKIISPGFIDIHIQGAGGADILDGNIEALQTMSKTLAKYGTTGFLATTLYHTKKANHHIQLTAENCYKDLGGANILGIQLEGPFINPLKKGGLNPKCIISSSLSCLEDIINITGNTLSIMTIAPELKNNLKIIQELKNHNVIPAFGHSNANYEETKAGIDAGISHVTHFMNAMNSIHHRKPGPIPAIFESDQVTVQIISDGVHIHPAIINMIYNQIDNQRIACITDGIQAIGLPDGNYIYSEKEYISKDGIARYLDGTLIGTAMSVNQIIERYKKFTNCTLEHAINTITINPAKILKIADKKGSIDVGKDADLVILHNDLSVWQTIIDGKVVYKSE